VRKRREKLLILVVAQRVDHVVGEFFAGYVGVAVLRHPALDLMSDGLHEMGLGPCRRRRTETNGL